MKRRASWGQFAHEIEKSQGSADFDIEFAMDIEIHTRARREVVLDSMTYKFSRVARDVVLDVIKMRFVGAQSTLKVDDVFLLIATVGCLLLEKCANGVRPGRTLSRNASQ